MQRKIVYFFTVSLQGGSDDDSSDEDQFTGKNALKAIADDSTSETSSSDEESLIGKMSIRTLSPPRTFLNETVLFSRHASHLRIDMFCCIDR